MKKLILAILAVFVWVFTNAHAESAHKGWAAMPAKWPAAEPPAPGMPVVRDVGMAGPGARVEEPDPPTNASFQGGYCFKTSSIVTVQRVYMLVTGEDGTISTKEIKTTPLSLHNKE